MQIKIIHDDRPAIMYDLDLQTLVFKENYYDLSVLELDERTVRRIFDNEVEQCLLNWFKGPGRGRFDNNSLANIWVSEDIEIDVENKITEASAITQFIELGLLVARKVRRVQGNKTP